MNDFEREFTEIATQKEKLQLLAEVMKVTVWGEDMSEWSRHWGVSDSLEDIDNGHTGKATHKYNRDIPPAICKFNRKALHAFGRRTVARLEIDGHTYDFILTPRPFDEEPDNSDPDATSIQDALDEMWHCDELYNTTYTQDGEPIPRDPAVPVYMPAGNYKLGGYGYEDLEVYVDIPADKRALAQTLAQLSVKYSELINTDHPHKSDDVRLQGMESVFHADRKYADREFELEIGANQISAHTARMLATMLAEDYDINFR